MQKFGSKTSVQPHKLGTKHSTPQKLGAKQVDETMMMTMTQPTKKQTIEG
jgi:hypothetical protein